MAQLVVAAAGAFVGFWIGGPTGAAVGWSLGSMLAAPTQKQRGPQLTDLRVTGTEAGAPIPYVFGHPRIAPYRILWISDRRAVDSTTSSKGGGVETTVTTYVVDVWFGLTDNEIAGGSRIWDNGKLIWSSHGDSDTDTIIASNGSDRWDRLTFYTGAADQLPDPTYEAAVGAASAVAYRRRGSMFIEGLRLSQSPALLPNLTVEVYRAGSPGFSAPQLQASIPCLRNFVVGTPSFDPAGYDVYVGDWDNTYTNKNVIAYHVQDGVVSPIAAGGFTVEGTNNEQNPGHGTTDVSCYVTYFSATQSVMYPERVFFTHGVNITDSPSLRFSRKGSNVVLGANIGSVTTVWRFGTGGGTPLATSSAMASGALAIAIGSSKVFVLNQAGTAVLRMTLSTLAVEATITSPATHAGTWIVSDDDDGLYLISDFIFKWNGATWDTISTAPAQIKVDPPLYSNCNLVDGIFYTLSGAGTTPDDGDADVYAAAITVTPDNETVEDVVSELCVRAGLDPSQFDVTALASITKPVRALAVSQIGNTRVTLELLMSAYFFEATAYDKVYFVPRGGAPVATLAFADLGAANDGTSEREPLALKQSNDLEIACQVITTALNADKDYQSDTQESARLANGSETVNTIQIPMAFTPAENKGIAQTILLDSNSSRVSTVLNLLGTYARLTPTDVVTVTDDDASTYRMRLVRCSEAQGVRAFEAVLDDANALIDEAETSSDDVSQTTVTSPPATLIKLLDIPILQDADDDAGFYMPAKGSSSAWGGAALYDSNDDSTFTLDGNVANNAIFGECTTTLGDWTGSRVFDEISSVTVDVGDGELSSSTRDALLNDATINAFAIGLDGRWELGQFRDAALQSAGVYKLTGLLRGSRGTEWAMVDHVADETFVLLRLAGMWRMAVDNSMLGVERFYKGVTIGRRLSSANSQAFTDNGVGLKPFSPFDVRASRIAGDITLTWQRRSRLAVRTIGPLGISVPLGEDSESYSIDIFSDGTYTTIVRTLSASSPTVVYTAAQQFADFGSPTLSTIYVKVYQISAAVGRGIPAQAAA